MIFRMHLTSGGHADIDTAGIEFDGVHNPTERMIIGALAEIVREGGWITVAETGQMVNLQYVTHVEPLPTLAEGWPERAAFVDGDGDPWYQHNGDRYTLHLNDPAGGYTQKWIEAHYGPLTYPPSTWQRR